MPYDSEIIVIGCGNVLFKDDGYGPIVINLLQKLFNDKNDYYDPAVTDYVDNIEANSATCQGIVYPDAFDDYVPGTPMVYGYCCGTTTNPTIGNAVAQESYNNTDMIFTTTITCGKNSL